MSSVLKQIPRIAIFLAGAGVATVALRRQKVAVEVPGLDELKSELANIDARLKAKETADEARFSQVETRLEEHSARLADVPSTSQIVAAMEQLLTKTMASLDDRLSTQQQSIEVLRGAVSQTDSLLERVLESIDSLQSYSEAPEFTEDPLLSRPAV
jgi:DNA repair exonuclease SbcCD ATPase subunit